MANPSNNDGRIHFGSLELSEMARIREENKMDAISVASTRVSVTERREAAHPTQTSSHVSAESLEAKKRHEELTKKYELQKAARQIAVPTSENEVKMRLRELKQPVTYFGETAADRRERLRALMAKILTETGELPKFSKIAKEKNVRDEENEHFYYEGPDALKEARAAIAKYSLKKAALRIEESKIKRMTIDPIEEEEMVEKEVAKIFDFEISMCQFADSSCVSRGCFSPDQKYFATSGWSGTCKLWTIPDCNLKTTLVGHLNRAIDITFHPYSGSNLSESPLTMASAGADNTVRIWKIEEDVEFQKSQVLKGHEDRVNRVLFHPAGEYLISVSHDKTWRMWDLEKMIEIQTQTGHSRPIYACSLQPDGSLVFTGDLGGFGMLWDLRTGKSVLPITGHVKQILSSDFHCNGYHLATGSDDNTVRFWDIRRKNCINILPAHTKLISDVKFQPGHSRFLATASYDKTCKIWSGKDWSLARTLVAHDSKVTSISISRDFEYIATTSLDRKWMLWSKPEKKKDVVDILGDFDKEVARLREDGEKNGVENGEKANEKAE